LLARTTSLKTVQIQRRLQRALDSESAPAG
jgi:hypothetical protein